MGYYADVSGTITFDRVLDEKTFETVAKLASNMFECECEREYKPKPDKDAVSSIDINDWNKFWAEDVLETLNDISSAAPILYGEVYYHGEEDEHIRFVFENDEWIEEYGDVEYGDPGLPFDYMAAAVRKFVEAEAALSESAAIYHKLIHEFGFTDHDLELMGLDWLVDLAGSVA